MEIGNNIKRLRKQKGLRQEQLAEAMGVSPASVSKWETNQSYPEMTTLVELADFFEVSLDTLMDHQLNVDRMESLIAQMQEAVEARLKDKAAALCEKLLRNYPNHSRVAEACADAYYQLHIYTGDRAYIEKCIEQTERLMLLKQDEPERERLERFHALGNQYGHLEEWEKAQAYYEKSNVNDSSRASIAECLLKLNKANEAVAMASEELLQGMFHLFQVVNTLADGWLALGNATKACAALAWLYDIMASMHFNATTMILVQVKLAGIRIDCGEQEAAENAIRRAAEQAGKDDKQELGAMADFLMTENARKMLISTSGSNRDMMLQLAEGLGESYAAIVKQVLQ